MKLVYRFIKLAMKKVEWPFLHWASPRSQSLRPRRFAFWCLWWEVKVWLMERDGSVPPLPRDAHPIRALAQLVDRWVVLHFDDKLDSSGEPWR